MQNQTNRQSTINGGTGLGLILIAAGVVFLAARHLPFDFGHLGWPLLVILTGVALVVGGFAKRTASGLLVPGSIITVVGLITAVQNTFSLWATWSYAWALVFPFSIGLGIALQGLLAHDLAAVRSGTTMAATGIAMFLVFGALFEGILRVSGSDLGAAGDLLIACILTASGVVLLVMRMASKRT
jgi:hypothetical protein